MTNTENQSLSDLASSALGLLLGLPVTGLEVSPEWVESRRLLLTELSARGWVVLDGSGPYWVVRLTRQGREARDAATLAAVGVLRSRLDF